MKFNHSIIELLQVIAFAERDQEDRLDPMIYIFPRMTKCTFHKFGSSGEVNNMRIMMTMMKFRTSGRVNDVFLKLCAFELDVPCPLPTNYMIIGPGCKA